jgi:hypothetical protein
LTSNMPLNYRHPSQYPLCVYLWMRLTDIRLYAMSSILVVDLFAAQLMRLATLNSFNLWFPDNKLRSMPVMRANCLNKVALVPIKVQSAA